MSLKTWTAGALSLGAETPARSSIYKRWDPPLKNPRPPTLCPPFTTQKTGHNGCSELYPYQMGRLRRRQRVLGIPLYRALRFVQRPAHIA